MGFIQQLFGKAPSLPPTNQDYDDLNETPISYGRSDGVWQAGTTIVSAGRGDQNFVSTYKLGDGGRSFLHHLQSGDIPLPPESPSDKSFG